MEEKDQTWPCSSFISSTPDLARLHVRVPTAPAEKLVGAGVATAHCWAGQRDDDELPRLACRDVLPWIGAPHACMHLSWPRTIEWTGGSPHSRASGRSRLILITGRHSYVLTLSVSSESAPCALSETARCPSDDILVHTPFGHTTKGMNQ